MDLRRAGRFLADHRQGILLTIRGNGRPQASNVVYHHADGVTRISVTSGRAKTRNLRRDPRAGLHVTSADFGRWVVAEGRAELSDVSARPGDAVGRELLEVYELIRDAAHPDPDEFFRAMVADQRLVVRIRIDRAYGQLPG